MKTYATSTNRHEKRVIILQCQSDDVGEQNEFFSAISRGQSKAAIGGAYSQQSGNKITIAKFTADAAIAELGRLGWTKEAWKVAA